MRVKKIVRVGLVVLLCILVAAAALTAVLFIRQAFRDTEINDDYAIVMADAAYREPVSVEGVKFIAQEISCGYAILEMLSHWQGKDVTEQSLWEGNGGSISTAMGTGFLSELSKQFPEWTVTRHVDLKNSELLREMHDALSAGMPVPIEFAALRDTEEGPVWTLHFAVVTGMDLSRDAITVQNPYGYEEVYTAQDFLCAARYDCYEDMELFFRFGFAFGLFHKNTMYAIQGG